MDPGDYWVLLALVAAAGGWAFLRGFRWWRWARLIEDTPTSRVRSAAQGYVELTGIGRRMSGAPVIAPLSRLPCTWWRYTVEQRTRDSRGRNRWRVINRAISDGLFFLEDQTGHCIVDPDGAEVLAAANDTWFGGTPMPVAGPPAQRGFRGFGNDYRYREWRMNDGDPLYAIGWFRTETNVQPGAVDSEVAALLRQWKRDRQALMKRFDTDGDGTLTLIEWERARREAHRQVLAERRQEATVPGVNVLQKPADGRPFLLAAADANALAHRYRLRASAGIALFIAAAAALAWLVIRGPT